LDNLLDIPKVIYACDTKMASLYAQDVKLSRSGIDFRVVGDKIDQNVHYPFPGRYNVSNCLAAIGATLYGLRIPVHIAGSAINSIEVIPGRMEQIDLGQDFTAIVDFAHTPNALREAISSAKEMTDKRVIAIFGSAGLRDKLKRRMMSEISLSLADVTVLTAEDPRTEDLDGILDEMSKAAEDAGGIEGKNFYRIPDRGEAIKYGVFMAEKGDIVIACGKGHEQSMCFGEIEYNWDDRTAMRSALAARLNIAGPKMPYLPTQDR